MQARAGIQIAQNAGIGLGAAAAGAVLLLRGVGAYPMVLLADAASFLVAGLLLTRLPALPAPAARAMVRRRLLPVVLTDRRFLAATALNAVLYLYMPVLSVLAPLWVAGRTAAPTWTLSGLFVVNTVGVVLSQRSAARRVRELSTAATSLRRGGLLLGAGCLGLWAAGLPDSAVLAAGPTVLVALHLTWSGPGWWVLAALFVGAAAALAGLADRAAGTLT